MKIRFKFYEEESTFNISLSEQGVVEACKKVKRKRALEKLIPNSKVEE